MFYGIKISLMNSFKKIELLLSDSLVSCLFRGNPNVRNEFIYQKTNLNAIPIK